MKLACESFGSGRPVLVLHGLFGSSECWRLPAQLLSDTRRVLCVDLPNHGRSPASATMNYDDMARDVLNLMSSESSSSYDVIGHCIGGKLAMAMALMAPEAIRKLCVIEAAPSLFLDSWMHQLRGMRRGLEVNGGSAGLAALTGSLLGQFMLPRAAIKNAYIDWRCQLGMVAPLLPQLRGFPERLQNLVSDLELHAFLGADSAFVRPADASSFLPMFPKTRVTVFDSTGHWVHAARPETLTHALREVLDSLQEDQAA